MIPAFADDLAKTVAHLNLPREVISDTEKFNNLRSLAFFRDFEDVELWEVLRISAWRRFQPGAFLIHEGDVGQSFFILADGQVQVLKGDKPLGILGPGESFGEMSYLRHGQHPRTASVITVAPSTLIKIKAEALTQASENCQLRFNRTFLDILVDRLDAANERIAGSARQ